MFDGCSIQERRNPLPPQIIPVAKAVFLCDGHIGIANHKTDLLGIFNSIHPKSYPHRQKHFVVYARLVEGLGPIQFFVEIRLASTGQLVHVSNTHTLHFPDRDTTVELALTLQNVLFPQAGVYLVELFLENQWVADAKLLLL
jgi:hypothetical protein